MALIAKDRMCENNQIQPKWGSYKYENMMKSSIVRKLLGTNIVGICFNECVIREDLIAAKIK